jgi:hypothetical protein
VTGPSVAREPEGHPAITTTSIVQLPGVQPQPWGTDLFSKFHKPMDPHDNHSHHVRGQDDRSLDNDSRSFASRRPAANGLPTFSLPAPPQPGPEVPSTQRAPLSSGLRAPFSRSTQSTLPSASTILTPHSGVTSDGLSPSSGVNTGSSQSSQPGYYPHVHGQWATPNNYSYTAPSSTAGMTSLAQPYSAGRAMYSPSAGAFPHRSTQSPATGDGLPAPVPSYTQSDIQSFQSGMTGAGGPPSGLSTPHAPASQLQNPILSSQSALTQALTSSIPTTASGDYRQPHSPYTPYPPTSTPGQASFPPTPTTGATTPRGVVQMAGPGISGMAPPIGYGTSGLPRPQYGYQPVAGPVMSNMHNPGGSMTIMTGTGIASQYPPPALHMYSNHTPSTERPFRCDQCTQAFNRNHDLKRHKRIHLAVKPYPCGACDKSFSRKDALKVSSYGGHGLAPLSQPRNLS